MRFSDFVKEVALVTFRNRSRTLLTVLSFAVGCFSIVTLMTLGHAVRSAISASLDTLGKNLIIITPEQAKGGPLGGYVAGSSLLTESDVTSIRQSAPDVAAVSSVLSSRGTVALAEQSTTTTILGVDADYAVVSRVEIDSGRFFDEDPGTHATAEAVMGATVARKLFESREPVGAAIRIDDHDVTVAGVAAARGRGITGVDEDDFVLVPKGYARQYLFARPTPDAVDLALAIASGSGEVDAAIDEIYDQMQKARPGDSARDLFSVRSLEGLMSTTLNAASLLTWLLVSMAAISVLVAGVGILNIMLANVSDRRLEIGVKLSVGASPLTVGMEFLVEAVVLAVIGASAGFVFAELAAIGFRALSYPAHVPPLSLLLSAVLALAVGVAAGWFPAFRAAHLDPKEVLRDAK